MNKSALFILHPGFEELEAVAPIDLMARAEIEVTQVSLSGELAVTGRNGITLMADCSLNEIEKDRAFDVVVLPGGPGINQIRQHPAICELLKKQHECGRSVAAICAAPLLLKDAGCLDADSKYTAFPATKEELPAASKESVVIDGSMITSRGAGTATEFGLTIVEKLRGSDIKDGIAQSICWPHASSEKAS